MSEFKVIVYVSTGYSTIVEADSEEEAIEIALNRESPDYLMWYEQNRVNQWEPEPLDEFPNLAKGEVPYVEEV